MLKKYFQKHEKWPLVLEIARGVKKSGGRVLLVGGAVRDALLKQRGREVEVKDIDLEVYGLDKGTLKRLLKQIARARHTSVKEVGKQFGVFNLGGIDVAIPRTESRTRPGMGRKPKVISQPYLSFEQASRRRDLTINALAFDPLTGEILDAHGGLKDLHRGILRHVSSATFGDDPLRVLRVMQFAGRFGFKIHSETVKLCRGITLQHLAKERVGEEWHKMMMKSPKPSIGLEAGLNLKIFQKLHPGLARMSQKDWSTTKRAVDFVAKHSTYNIQHTMPDAAHRETLLFAALTHRLKPEAIRKFFQQINLPKKQAASVSALVHLSVLPKRLTDEHVRRLAYELSKAGLSVEDMALLLKALGKNSVGLMNRAKVLQVVNEGPKPLVQGSDLLRLGVKPGKGMGELLSKTFEEQLKGHFDDKKHRPQKKSALAWIEAKI